VEIRSARAHWVSRDVIAWDAARSGVNARLHVGDQVVDLLPEPSGLPEVVRKKFPHLAALPALRIPSRLDVRAALREPHFVSTDESLTGLQIPGVLDDLFIYDGPLGVTQEGEIPVLRVWAPTARSVTLLLDSDRVRMNLDGQSGVWTARGDGSWRNRFYNYEVEVFVRTTGRIEKNIVTDPYSISLSSNSRRSQVVDLNDPALKPEGWDALKKPPLEHPVDSVVYELHIRDFSMNDPAVPPEHRGTYLAFRHRDSYGMRHLLGHTRAGLTHLHLLPAFDFTTVNDVRSEWADPGELSGFPPDSREQQAAVAGVRNHDGFNWGYDPWHYFVPDGSYATNPEGTARIREFREMVKALAEAGLRVVMDVVYNHTSAAGQSEKSVLDRIVPGYYHRLNAEGGIESSTCCSNTATEHVMMEKLMIDSLLVWARAYRIDGFRFDLMGHHMKSNLERARDALRRVDPTILLYGEGWDFGEVANNARGINASQRNMAGTGIGMFNDRLRDATRGGGPFTGLQEQGFATGVADEPQQQGKLAYLADLIRIALGGSLKDLPIRRGRAGGLEFRGQGAGFTAEPQEAVNYVAAHDNETLFDAITLKAARNLPMAERVRVNNLAVSLVMLAQGIAFFHAGDDLLRSKSLDRNSYDSGDWFNRIHFTLQTNNFGVGLPPAWDNERYWPVFRPLLADPALRPAPADIARAVDHFREMLRIRKSTAMFRLRDAAAINRAVRFHSGDAGLITVSLSGRSGELVVFVINAYGSERSVMAGEFANAGLGLHPVQQSSSDPVVVRSRYESGSGNFIVPGRTAAVFWRRPTL
jgi:pullulanase